MIAKTSAFPLQPNRDHSVQTRARIDVLTDELSSGRTHDLGRAVANDFSRLSRVAHDLRTITARQASLSHASDWLSTAQLSLTKIQQANDSMLRQIPASVTPGGIARVDTLAFLGRSALADIGIALNASHAGRPIFANGDPSASIPIDTAVIEQETAALAAAAPDLDTFLLALDAYFGPPPSSGVDMVAIRPFDPRSVEVPLGGGDALSIDLSLHDGNIRSSIKQAALVASLDRIAFALSADDRSRLAIKLPERSSGAATGITVVQSRLGALEERVTQLTAGMDQEKVNLTRRESLATNADPFETATKLQSEMTRLETIYTITARRARLRLSDYIR